MLTVKRKQTLGKCGKPITENVSARARETPGRHRGKACAAPSLTAENTDGGIALKKKYNCYIAVFIFIFTGKRQ